MNRDTRISFEEDTHTYHIDGDASNWISVTTFIHTFFKPFDSVSVATKMVNRPDFKSKYSNYQLEHTDKQDLINKIVALWQDNAKEASRQGTEMHAKIEAFYLGKEILDEGIEYDFFRDFAKNRIQKGYEPFRTEWRVFDEDSKIAGSIDMVYYHKEKDAYSIVDWKRCKEIKYSGFDRGLGPASKLQDCNYIHYSLQLNLYKYILEKNYGIKVFELSIVTVHPSCMGEIEIVDMDISELINTRH